LCLSCVVLCCVVLCCVCVCVCVVAGRGSGAAGTSGSIPTREHVDEIYSLVFDEHNVHQQVTM
jgi:hypothetical protein